MFVSTERLLSEHQIDFDIVSEDALAKDLVPHGGAFGTMSGNRYPTVIVPAPPSSQAALDRLRNFAAGGGHVLFLGPTPSFIAGPTILNARAATPEEFSWATLVPDELPPTPTPGDLPPAQPPQPQVVPAPILRSILATIPVRDLTLDQPHPALRVIERRWKHADVYLFFNEGSEPSRHTITPRRPTKDRQRLGPADGNVQTPPGRAVADEFAVPRGTPRL